MAKKDKRGKDIVEYPKLVKVGDKKVRVLNAEDEAKLLNQPDLTKKEEDKKPAGWGK